MADAGGIVLDHIGGVFRRRLSAVFRLPRRGAYPGDECAPDFIFARPGDGARAFHYGEIAVPGRVVAHSDHIRFQARGRETDAFVKRVGDDCGGVALHHPKT